jgi:hypothetical protein
MIQNFGRALLELAGLDSQACLTPGSCLCNPALVARSSDAISQGRFQPNAGYEVLLS